MSARQKKKSTKSGGAKKKRSAPAKKSSAVKKGAAAERGAEAADSKSAQKATAAEPAMTISLEDLFPPALKRSWQEEAESIQASNIAAAREAYIHHGLVLYIGAGVSGSVGLPTWWEMIRSLTVTMMSRKVDSAAAALQSLTVEQKAMAKVRIQEEVTKGEVADKSILIMARSIKEFFGEQLPYEMAQTLYGPLLKSSPDFWEQWWRMVVPSRRARADDGLNKYPAIGESKLFSAIVQLARAQRDVRGVQAIVNFNYDDLIEEWMREKGIRCDTLLSGRESGRDASLPCYHVHGVLPFRRIQELKPTKNKPTDLGPIIGNFVFSEDEYHTEYSDPYRWSNMTMINQLARYSGLFVGLSLEDPNLRRLIDVTHRQYPDVINYAILTRKVPKGAGANSKQSILRDLFERVETESFANIGVRVIWTDPTDNFKEVPARILDICDIDSGVGRKAGASPPPSETGPEPAAAQPPRPT